jgi:hypothetical protein
MREAPNRAEKVLIATNPDRVQKIEGEEAQAR